MLIVESFILVVSSEAMLERSSINDRDSIAKPHDAENLELTHLSLASLLWDIGKQHSTRCDAAERGVPSGAILFAWRNFIEK